MNNNDKLITNIFQEETPKPGLVPPFLAAILSLIIPGLGQVLSRAIRRGLLLLFSLATIVGLMIWRINLTARRDTGFIAKITKSFHLEPIILILAVLIVVLYFWIGLDAYVIAKRSKSSPLGLFFFIIVVFFFLGWQIGQIDPVALVTGADDAAPVVKSIAWPWEAAIDIPKDIVKTSAKIQVPCSDIQAPPPQSEPLEDEPYLVADPTCGDLSEQQKASGSLIKLKGYNFNPDLEIEMWWKDHLINVFRHRQEGAYLKLMPDEDGSFEIEITIPYAIIPDQIEEIGYVIWDVQGWQTVGVGEWEFSGELKLIVEKMIETIFIGMMATFFGVILAVPVSFLAARNLMSASKFTIFIYFIVRGILNIIRSIEPLIWAIIFVIIVGLGPFAGILALTVHSIAALGKLYSESIESIDTGPIEAIHATGANWLQTVVFAVIPQIIPPFVSFTIYRWDINIRMSTIVGFVGGGGIGFLLAQFIRLLVYRPAGICVWFIAVTVAILDYVSAEIRARFV